MITITNELNDLQAEIENLLKFEIAIENNDITIPSDLNKLKLKSSLKSSLMLMLYNAVEATVTKCLTRIHSEINTGCLNYHNLTEPLQKLYLLL